MLVFTIGVHICTVGKDKVNGAIENDAAIMNCCGSGCIVDASFGNVPCFAAALAKVFLAAVEDIDGIRKVGGTDGLPLASIVEGDEVDVRVPLVAEFRLFEHTLECSREDDIGAVGRHHKIVHFVFFIIHINNLVISILCGDGVTTQNVRSVGIALDVNAVRTAIIH